MPLELSQVRVDSLLGASCPECEVQVDQPQHRASRLGAGWPVLVLPPGPGDNQVQATKAKPLLSTGTVAVERMSILTSDRTGSNTLEAVLYL